MMQQFLSALGYQFKNPALLRRALTHPSMGPEDNQRLEFLGDAVLQYIMSDILYQSHPDCHEGQLTHLRALSVCEANLSQVAKKLHVGEALIMDKGEELTGGREKPSVLCDAMEAILAAVYLDGGLDAARAIILRCWPKPEDVQRPMQDSKGALQEFLQRDGSEAPTYEIIAQDGPPHNRTFEAAVSRFGVELAHGTGRTKKQAEQAAALRRCKSSNPATSRNNSHRLQTDVPEVVRVALRSAFFSVWYVEMNRSHLNCVLSANKTSEGGSSRCKPLRNAHGIVCGRLRRNMCCIRSSS